MRILILNCERASTERTIMLKLKRNSVLMHSNRNRNRNDLFKKELEVDMSEVLCAIGVSIHFNYLFFLCLFIFIWLSPKNKFKSSAWSKCDYIIYSLSPSSLLFLRSIDSLFKLCVIEKIEKKNLPILWTFKVPFYSRDNE